MLEGDWVESILSLVCTVSLGLYFSMLQLFEYVIASFTISDGIYGSSFYVATGFHGLHVLVGTIFIIVVSYRNFCYHFSRDHHFGFEASA